MCLSAANAARQLGLSSTPSFSSATSREGDIASEQVSANVCKSEGYKYTRTHINDRVHYTNIIHAIKIKSN